MLHAGEGTASPPFSGFLFWFFFWRGEGGLKLSKFLNSKVFEYQIPGMGSKEGVSVAQK